MASDEVDFLRQLRLALVPVDGFPQPVPEEEREEARKRAERAQRAMGAGIDPKVVLSCLEDFRGALTADPACLPAYFGLCKAAQGLAAARPVQASELLQSAVLWLEQASVRLAALQESEEVHDLERRLRAAWHKAKERPRASGQAVRVKLDRDAEGRILSKRRRHRFRPSSGELRALLPGLPRPNEERELPSWLPALGAVQLIAGALCTWQGALHYIVNGTLIASGLLLLALPGLVWIGEKTRGLAPGFLAVVTFAVCVLLTSWLERPHPEAAAPAPQAVTLSFGRPIDDAYRDLKSSLWLATPKVEPPPGFTQLAVVSETGDPAHPLTVDPLHARLPAGLAASRAKRIRYVIVVRRLPGKADDMLAVWVLDAEARKVVARTAFSGGRLRGLEDRALAWLKGLSGEK